MDGWSVAKGKRGKNKKNDAKKKKPKPKATANTDLPASATEESFDPPILNDVFNTVPKEADWAPPPQQPKEEWTNVVSHKSKKKRKKAEHREKEEERKEEERKNAQAKKPQKPKSEILREKDEIRARSALRRGDEVLIDDEFEGEQYVAEIINVDGNKLTVVYNSMQVNVERNARNILPIWDHYLKCYLPADKPKKQKKKKQAPEPAKKETKKKKPKKKGPKKLTSEVAILNQVSSIVETHGSNNEMGLPEIMNQLKEYLQGGSWNQKKYKGKFGSMKKFLSRFPERFVVTDTDKGVKIERLPPPPPKPKKKKSKSKPSKKQESRKGSSLTSVIMLVLLFTVIAGGLLIFMDDESELPKKIEGQLRELFGVPKGEL